MCSAVNSVDRKSAGHPPDREGVSISTGYTETLIEQCGLLVLFCARSKPFGRSFNFIRPFGNRSKTKSSSHQKI